MAPSGSEDGPGGWRFWIDRGGTFTDLVGQAPDGSLVVRKVLSERGRSVAEGAAADGAVEVAVSQRSAGAAHPTDPAVAAIREVLGLAAGQPLPEGLVEEVRLGTTVATNALLERRVEPVLLLVNRGFADVAAIGEQHRPDIFALRVERPPLLPYRVLEVPGRLAADGGEVEPFHRDPALELQLRQARAKGLSSCAVALLHAVADPAHELVVGAWLVELGFESVLLSHRVGGLPRLLPRLHTTLVEAAVRPVLQAYLAQVRQALGPGTRLRVMTSAGVLQPPDQLLAKDTVLSGPAGGLGGAVAAARAAGLAEQPILGFDMGGTSTDVFHLEVGAGIELSPETAVAGLRLQAPTLPIHTVAAGGGSVVRLEGGRLQVGPASAGAIPGPACYRRGGPLTITDANLLLGRLPEGALPPVFGPGGDQPPDAAIVRRGFEALAAELVQGSAGLASGGSDQAGGGHQPSARPEGPGTPSLPTPEALAQGARSIALERMAEAIRRISIQRGHDIRTAVLVSYGGAGGQHACALAERLGVERVLLHPLAGVLSAYGLGLSRQEALRHEAVQRVLEPALLSELRRRRDGLLAEASQALHEAGDLPGDLSAARLSLEMRPAGGERGLELPWLDADTTADLRTAFETRHRQRFGYVVEGEALVVERLQVLLPAGSEGPEEPGSGGAPALWQEWAAADGARGSGAEPCSTSLSDALGSLSPVMPPEEELQAQVARRSPFGGLAPGMDLSQGRVDPGSPPEVCRWVPLCLPVADAGQVSIGDLAWRPVPCWRREELQLGQRLVGPALVLEATGTTVLEPGWGGRVLPDGALLLEPLAQGVPWGSAAPGGSGRPSAASDSLEPVVHCGSDPSGSDPSGDQPRQPDQPGQLDPVRLELYNHRFSAIAEQMGVRLQQSSRSVNIRERLDFSCALFDGAGQLVANAPHIPVHLGSMGESVAALLAAISRGERLPLAPGDAVASNDPYSGGTHLPDITVISPVFAPGLGMDWSDAEGSVGAGSVGGGSLDARLPLFYVACRGHHADVGGLTPGSMPPFSRSILEEGLRLDNVPLIQDGRLDLGAWMERLADGHQPVRDPERLLADLQAQVAANRLGVAELHRLMTQQGTADVVAAMGDVQCNAAEAVRLVIDRLRPGRHVVELDDGSRIVVAVEPDHGRRRVRVDFSGTSPQQGGNLNAPLAITKAVVLYVFRVLVEQPIPLNAGCFEPIDLVVPPGCLLHPTFPAAVVGGNVETSQAVANALFGALGVLAAGQGTMNNLSFGNDRCQYYETVAGGSGAGVLADGSGFAGCSAVQSHMTNSRLTDPEILEARFPVRLERFARRRGSGGIGRWRGGGWGGAGVAGAGADHPGDPLRLAAGGALRLGRRRRGPVRPQCVAAGRWRLRGAGGLGPGGDGAGRSLCAGDPRRRGLGGGLRARRFRRRSGAGRGAAEQRIRAQHEHCCRAVRGAAGRSAALSRFPSSSRVPVRLAGLQLMAAALVAAPLVAAPLHAAPLVAAPFQAALFQPVSLSPLSLQGAPLRPLASLKASHPWPLSVARQASGSRLARSPLARPGRLEGASGAGTIRPEPRRAFVAGASSTAAARPAAPTPAPAPNELQEAGQRFQPLWSARGMVASQEGRASAVGAAILRQGGNAVDGAVATAFALAVTLPQAGNLGGGGFLVLWLPGESPARARGCLGPGVSGSAGLVGPHAQAGPERPIGQGFAVAVNFRETAPAAARADLFLRGDGSVDRQRATRSLQSTAVPGSVAGLLLAQRCYGRLPLQVVMAPAIALAERGVPVDRELADSLTAALPLLAADPTSRALYLRPARRGTGPDAPLRPVTGPPQAAVGAPVRSPGLAGLGRAPASLAVAGSPRPAELPLITEPPLASPAPPGLGRGEAPPATPGLPAPARPSVPPDAPGSGAAPPALRALQPGEVLRQAELAATLRRIVRQGEAGFYRGPVAAALVNLMRQRGGLIQSVDLATYRAELVRPLAGRFADHPVLSMPPPGGGLTLLQLLGLLDPADLAASGAGSAASLHRLTEAMNLAYRDRNTWLGDPASMATPPPDLLDSAYLDQLRRRIDPLRHRPAAEIAAPPPPRRESVNTTHLSVADRHGGLVALTTTLNFAYGNGVTVPGAGFLLNNEMDDFTAAPGRPNSFALVQGEANAITPGRRPLSSMAPTLVFRPDGTPWLATGSPGGSRIITTVAQVLLQRILWGANLATAVAAPRIHSQLWPDRLSLEEGISPDTRRLLEAMGHITKSSPAMGAANSVEVLAPRGSGSLGAVDPRRGRTAAVGE